MQKIEIGKNAFPDLSPGLTLPITPDWVEITAAGSRRLLTDPPSGACPAALAGQAPF